MTPEVAEILVAGFKSGFSFGCFLIAIGLIIGGK